MTLRKLICICTLLGICFIAKSQDTTTITVDTIKYVKKSERFYLNNKKIQVADMKPMLMEYNLSAMEFKQYQRKATPGTIILLTSLTSGVIAFTRINKDKRFFTPYSITLFVGDLIGIPLMIWAKNHLKKSAALYNKQILSGH